jgi:threonine dehydrogenase-like Zn-dependent dehydrogenase
MRALHFHQNLSLVSNFPEPEPSPGSVRIQVTAAAICNTDLEITRGYIPDFNGIPGHEFFGQVDAVADTAHRELIGKRVTAEINCGCGVCAWCREGLERHCPDRTVIGINNRNGAFSQYCTVPAANIVAIPPAISDDNALFIEPLAAAFEIQDQISISRDSKVLLLGDGKLAHCIAWSLLPTECRLRIGGKHAWKTALLQKCGFDATIDHSLFSDNEFDIVIEASGSPGAFNEAIAMVRPRGTIVLKSTYSKGFEFNPAAVVVNEISLIGSRCGQFSSSIAFLEKHSPDLSYLISKRFPLSEGICAFAAARQPDIMKVVLDCQK